MKPHDSMLGLSIQEVARLTPEQFKRFKYVQRSHEDDRKRRNEPNPPEPLDLKVVLAMDRSKFDVLRLERKGRLIQERELKRQQRNAKFEQRNTKFEQQDAKVEQQDAKREYLNVGYDEPPDNPNELTLEQYERIRQLQKQNRFEALAMRARGLHNDYM